MRSSCKYLRDEVARIAAHTSISWRNASSTMNEPIKPEAPVINILFFIKIM